MGYISDFILNVEEIWKNKQQFYWIHEVLFIMSNNILRSKIQEPLNLFYNKATTENEEKHNIRQKIMDI